MRTTNDTTDNKSIFTTADLTWNYVCHHQLLLRQRSKHTCRRGQVVRR